MSLSNDQQIKLHEGFDVQQLEPSLAEHFPLRREETIVQKLGFYDTFDWRLFNKSLTLHREHQGLYLRRLPAGEDLLSLTDVPTMKFVWDLPEGVLRDELASIVEMRALLQLGEISTRSQIYRILNQDEKTVARLVCIQVGASPMGDEPYASAYLRVSPVRGYAKFARRLAEYIQEFGEPAYLWEDLYRNAMQASATVPGNYSTKLDLQLEHGMRADEASRAILRRLFVVMRSNEEGIRADIDIEFLHDYRVATRRTRSALGQIKGVFPAQAVARFRQSFADLGELSNELRDLDVYLLSEQNYRDMLPAAIMDDISPLFDFLRSRRPQALQRVIDHFNSHEYAQFLADWEAFLNESPKQTSEAPNAERPIIEIARERIYKHFQRVMKDGNHLLDHPSDERMHALRIECKKLRYLIEFFASLFPTRKVVILVDQLKMLQDNLGEFNDLQVQQRYLLNVSEELPFQQTESRLTLVAIGALVKSLAQRQQTVRADFAQTFTGFASPDNQKRYRSLFASKPQGSPDDNDRPVQQ